MTVKDQMWPYVFCNNCNKLTPLDHDAITDKPECMVCGYALLSDNAGRQVLFTKEEAQIRKLPLVK